MWFNCNFLGILLKIFCWLWILILRTKCEIIQEAEYASVEGNKPAQRSASSRRSRAAQVHNLSERVSLEQMHQSMYFNPLLNTIMRSSLFQTESKLNYKTMLSIAPFLMQRRRDRINEKMKALQELIPNCNKVWSSVFSFLSSKMTYPFARVVNTLLPINYFLIFQYFFNQILANSIK